MDTKPATTCTIDTEDPLERVKEVGADRPFRLMNKRLMVTYKYHIRKNKLEDMFKAAAKEIDARVVFFRAAHEQPHKDDLKMPYEHTHAVVEFNKSFTTRVCRVFDMVYKKENVHPHIKPISNNTHWRRCLVYLSKEDPENADLKGEGPGLATRVQDQLSLTLALDEYATKFSDAAGVALMYSLRQPHKDPPPIKLYRWQIELVRIIEKDIYRFPDIPPEDFPEELWKDTDMNPKIFKGFKADRCFRVIWDPPGTHGKSILAEYLRRTNPKRYLLCKGLGQMRDMATVISNALDKGWEGQVVLVDLVRNEADHVGLYTALEALRDGKFMATKYQGGMVDYDAMHVVIFTNWMPNLTKVTIDRWKIHGIVPGKCILRDVHLSEALEIYAAEYADRHKRDSGEDHGL